MGKVLVSDIKISEWNKIRVVQMYLIHRLLIALNSEQISWAFYVNYTLKVIKYTYLLLHNVVIEFVTYVFPKTVNIDKKCFCHSFYLSETSFRACRLTKL